MICYTQVMLMDLVNKDKNSGMTAPPVWATYQTLLDASEEKKVRYVQLETTFYHYYARKHHLKPKAPPP